MQNVDRQISLALANGKDHIKEERLRPYDKAKHEIYKALKEELPTAHSWDNLKMRLPTGRLI